MPPARLASLVLLLASVACADPATTPRSAPATSTAPAATRSAAPGRDPAQVYEVTAMVLESPDHGPQLCAGAIATSLPPQCGGPDVAGFEWADVEGELAQGGTTYGSWRLVGTFDGKTFRLTEPPSPPAPPTKEPPRSDPTKTPCPEPRGGWTVVDRAKTGNEAQDAAIGYARKQPDHSGVWLSWPHGLPGDGDAADHGDPLLNLAFTGDLERHEREAREHWGGALCVTKHARTYRELRRVQAELMDDRAEAERAGVYLLAGGTDESDNVIRAEVLIADDVTRRWLDEKFGPGMVEVEGRFQPVG